MLVRIFTGASWVTAEELGDYSFDVLPAVGHKLALASGHGWNVAGVRDVAHRLVNERESADIALLLSPMIDGDMADGPLPLAAFDRIGGVSGVPSTSSSNDGPWARR